MSFIAIIPARLDSTRLPRKVLAEIHGIPMIAHVVQRARESSASRVIVATDNSEVVDAVHAIGAEAMLTSKDHQNGTERLAEVVKALGLDDGEVIVNVQGDEPFIDPTHITQVAHDLTVHAAADVATLATPIQDARDAADTNIVKTVLNADGYALYFSRALIPWDRDAGGFGVNYGLLRHIGLYAYRAGFLKQYSSMEETSLEKTEKLEQLRVLYYGHKIHVSTVASATSLGVDTAEDLERIRNMKTEFHAKTN